MDKQTLEKAIYYKQEAEKMQKLKEILKLREGILIDSDVALYSTGYYKDLRNEMAAVVDKYIRDFEKKFQEM